MNQREMQDSAVGADRSADRGERAEAARAATLRWAGRALRVGGPLIAGGATISGNLYVDDTDPVSVRHRMTVLPRLGRATVIGATEFRYVPTRAAIRAAATGGPTHDTFVVTGTEPSGTTRRIAVVVPVGTGTREPQVATSANTVTTATIPLPHTPGALAMSPDGERLYAVSPEAAVVSVIDVMSSRVVETFDLTGPAAALVVDTHRPRIYAAIAGSNCVDVVDTATGEILDSLWIDAPMRLALSTDGTRLVVATRGGEIEVIDTATIRTLVNLDDLGTVCGVLLSPDDSRLHVVTEDASACAVQLVESPTHAPLPTHRFTARGVIGGVAMSADGRRLALLDAGAHGHGDCLIVLDAATLMTVHTVSLAPGHSAPMFAADGRSVVAVNSLDETVTVVDVDGERSGAVTVRAGARPRCVVVAPDGDTVYCAGADGVTVLSRTVTGTVLGGLLDSGVHHELRRPPRHGTVSVCEDGSFVYTADGPFVTDDRFAVRIDDLYERNAPVDADVIVVGIR
ncbi:WD40 repeat domain-containing protein [Williamsia sp. MIQD14]|uniref:WD40 repeat domain-containing protein n=1 Tax=Williamsia sp. MIQD14 TaxID=3425703 RepID=UPI003DA185CB